MPHSSEISNLSRPGSGLSLSVLGWYSSLLISFLLLTEKLSLRKGGGVHKLSQTVCNRCRFAKLDSFYNFLSHFGLSRKEFLSSVMFPRSLRTFPRFDFGGKTRQAPFITREEKLKRANLLKNNFGCLKALTAHYAIKVNIHSSKVDFVSPTTLVNHSRHAIFIFEQEDEEQPACAQKNFSLTFRLKKWTEWIMRSSE